MPGSRPHRAKADRPESSRALLLPHDAGDGVADFPVVGIGASAGGFDACRKLVDALPAGNGMAFILVQHLDPTHESMMVDLLAGHTSMTVLQATDGMPIEREHLYVIPPGTYLSVSSGALHLSQPQARHGARLPFDFLLHSLAEEYGARAICVILSGTGADGSLGLKAVKEKGGLVIAQDPDEAGYDGMPRSAITTGAVDLVLPVAEDSRGARRIRQADGPRRRPDARMRQMQRRIGCPRSSIFCARRPPTISRSTSRARCSAGSSGAWRWRRSIRWHRAISNFCAATQASSTFSPRTCSSTSPASSVIRRCSISWRRRSFRTWSAASRPIARFVSGSPDAARARRPIPSPCCSARRSRRRKRDIKLQVFASDVDPDAVASAREGLYPETIEADVSPARLARFFSKEDHGYRVSPELRAAVVFTVQDVLADPPFSRLDLVSCRNLLIYLRPEAQAKVISLFHFALREGGILLLGNSETVGDIDGRFEVISKPERLYRRIGRSRPGEFGFSNERRRRRASPRAPGTSARRPRAKPLSPSFVGGW